MEQSACAVQPLTRSCLHCGTAVPDRMRSEFCCSGCETVHGILSGAGLSGYYDVMSRSGARARPAAPAPKEEGGSFAYLDLPESRASHESGGAVRFYLEGVHCAACVWLVEKLPRLVPGVESVRLDLGNGVATVRLRAGGTYAAAAAGLLSLGYRPHAVQASGAEALRRAEDRRLLVGLGIAAACAGNIMLLAVSLYAGADGGLAREFRWVSFALSLPVMGYCALPFYRSALASLRARQLSIDVPVALGLLVSFGVSAANLALGNDRIYFDSVATLVFLLLASRYLLRRVQQSSLTASSLAHLLMPSVARIVPQGAAPRMEATESLRAGDVVEVLPGECIPADGEVVDGHSSLNASLLTGESRPEAAAPGTPVYAGTLNLSSPLRVRVSVAGGSTRMGQILESMQASLARRAPIVAFSDRVSQGFVAFTLLLAPIVFALGWSQGGRGFEAGLDRALALALVTCPCAFALATPLTFAVAMGRCARAGILIKGADVLERISRAGTAFLDKTGTLTEGRFSVLSWESELAEHEAAAVVVALESASRHPIARALVERFAGSAPLVLPRVENLRERMGEGVSGSIAGQEWGVRAAERPAAAAGIETQVSLYRAGRAVGTATLGDALRPEAPRVIRELRALGLEPRILSGDSEAAVGQVARALGLSPRAAVSEASPERKKAVVDGDPRALMVGDGTNDAVALASAYVSVAVHGGLEASIRAADAYFSRPGLRQLPLLVEISRETMKVVRRNFAISLAYNAAAATAAALGKIDPFFAAILMPVSAFAVFASAISGTSRMRAAVRELRDLKEAA